MVQLPATRSSNAWRRDTFGSQAKAMSQPLLRPIVIRQRPSSGTRSS
jgi:hypothetical protein